MVSKPSQSGSQAGTEDVEKYLSVLLPPKQSCSLQIIFSVHPVISQDLELFTACKKIIKAAKLIICLFIIWLMDFV